MNLLYIRILATNKVQRAIKHVSVTFFCIFAEMSHKFATAYLGGISDGSAAHVICTCELQSQGVYLMALLQMSYVCDTLQGLFDTLSAKFKPQFNEPIKLLQFRDLYRFKGKSAEEWMGRL